MSNHDFVIVYRLYRARHRPIACGFAVLSLRFPMFPVLPGRTAHEPYGSIPVFSKKKKKKKKKQKAHWYGSMSRLGHVGNTGNTGNAATGASMAYGQPLTDWLIGMAPATVATYGSRLHHRPAVRRRAVLQGAYPTPGAVEDRGWVRRQRPR